MDFNNKVMETLTAITENNEEDKQDLENLKQALIDGTFNVKYLTWAIMATNDENGNRIIDTYATIERLTQVLEALTQEISDRKAADDLEKKERKEETTAIINSVNQEISDRTNAVSVLNNLITAETENRASEDEKVLQYAQSVNEALGNAKTDLQGKIDSEAQTRLTSDNEIKASITSKEDGLKALINSVKTELNGSITTLSNRVNNLPTNYVFDTYESMTNDLLNASNTKYKVGDTLFIKEVNKPDYWVSAILSTKGTYGYYEISIQESKVDLSNYVKISELSREAIEEKFLETVENGRTKSFAARSFAATSRNSGIDVNNYAEYGYDGVSFHKNGMEYPLGFPEKDGVFALTSDIPQALKNPFALTINGQVYDGSSAVSITTETITEHDFVRFWHAGIEIQNDGSEHVLRLSDFDTELEEFSPHISCQYDGPQYYWIWKFPQISGTFAMESQIPTKLSQLKNDGNYQTNTSDLKDNTTTFTTASSRSNVASGEKLSVSFGKIAKYFTDLKAIAFSGERADIGLGNVDNTSDANKPVSNATQQALNLKANSSDVYTKTETDGLLNNKANANDVYSKTETDELLNNKANSSDVYTKSESDTGLNKSLYNLGAYDTISGNTIIRQTGYVDLSKLSWGVSNLSAYDGQCTQIHINLPNTSSEATSFISNILIPDGTFNPTLYHAIISSNNIYFNIPLQTSTDSAIAYTLNLGIQLQYKLATSYTEEIIEGQPLITLDQQGSQWLRDEWEKGLNVWDEQWEVGGIDASGRETISNENIRNKNYIEVKPNAPYYYASSSRCFLCYYNSNKAFISGIGINANTSFTTNVNAKYIRFSLVSSYGATYKNDIAIFEGDHPYPYQAYNGEIVHDKDIADLYKQEYNLGYYDTMVENSDGTYTITRQTGYYNISNDLIEHGYYRATQGSHGEYGGDVGIHNFPIVSEQKSFINNLLAVRDTGEIYAGSIGIAITRDGGCWMNLGDNYNSKEKYVEYLSRNNIYIQYKLTTSYTERVEKNHYARYNQDFILEHNTSEAERSVNLLENKNIQSYNLDFLENNTTYTLSFSLSESIGFTLADGTSTIVDRNLSSGYNSFTFVKKSGGNAFIWFSNASKVSNLMLNEGSEPLPYQPYEGKVVHEKQIENITPGIFSLVGNNVDTLTISKNETYFIVSVAVNPIYVEGNSGISFIGSSLVTTVGMLSGDPKICINGSAYSLDNNSVTLKTSGLMKVYKVNY